MQELKRFNSQTIEEMKNATMANTKDIQGLPQATTGLEEWIGQSKKEYPVEHQLEPITQYWDNASIDDNREEEELQGQLMAERHYYMIDEDESKKFYHEHVQATTNLERELNYLSKDEIFEFILNYQEESATLNYLPKDEVFECCPTAHIDDLKMRIHQFKAARTIYIRVMNKFEPCLFCEYCFNPTHHQSECPFILNYLVDEDEVVDNKEEHTKQVEHAQVTTLENEEIVDNNEEEQVEHIEQVKHHEKSGPPTDPNLPSDMEESAEAFAYITAPLETHQEPKALSLECLQEPFNVKILKDLCTQARKSRNHFPKKILRSKQFYIRWQNILPEGYEVLKKKGWKGLVGHQYDRIKCCKVFSPSLFFALHSINSFFPFSFMFLVLFLFLTAINHLMFCFYEKNIVVSFVDRCFGV